MMTVMYVLIGVLFISLSVNAAVISFYKSLKKEKLRVDSEIIKARSDLDYYIRVNQIAKEVAKEYEEKEKKLNTGDIHSRNSAAADILRNIKH